MRRLKSLGPLPPLLACLALLAAALACSSEPSPSLPAPAYAVASEAGVASGAVASPAVYTLPPPVAALPSVADVVEAVRPAVVSIASRVETGGLFFQRLAATGNGTGVIVHPDGYIVTNNHVISGATRIVVTTDDGQSYDAVVVGTDPATDLAVLRIEGAAPFPALTFALPDSVRVGDWAIAIGNALGLPGGPSVTLGVVGAVDRSLTTHRQALMDLIQTDAAINEGNSGGPLVDLNGEIIGINTAVVRGAQGMSFSISTFTVMPVVESIMEHGRVRWPWMGVGVQDITAPMALEMDLANRRGVLINRIWPDSPAHSAGLQVGDILLSINGADTDTVRALQRVMREHLSVGDQVTATLSRPATDDDVHLELTLAEMPR